MNNCSKKRKAGEQSQTTCGNPHEEEQTCEEKGNSHDLPDSRYLPIPIVSDILSRVVIKTLLNCRLVCKSWADLIYTPEFAKLHLLRSPTVCLIKYLDDPTMCLIKCRKEEHHLRRLYLINPECPNRRTNELVFFPNINLPDVSLGLMNSCNGLVCLIRMKKHDYFYASKCDIIVCNPVLKEYISLPRPPINSKEYRTECCAFGFSHITNQYKVVLSSYDFNSQNYKTNIYTLGEGSWRSIENAPSQIRNMNYNAYLNGAIHWIDWHHGYLCIHCFHFESEEFRVVELPNRCLYRIDVGVINDNLSVWGFNWNNLMIWIMKDYGVKESWSMDFVIPRKMFGYNWDKYEPIMINGNGEILMIFNHLFVRLYDPKSQVAGPRDNFRVNSEFRAIAHVPSFISLKDFAKGENLKVVGRRG